MNSRRGTDVRKRRHQVGVRLLPEEAEKLRKRAERDGVSPAEVLRRAFLTAT
jgi:Ribbon-helix-helix protein, copG family